MIFLFKNRFLWSYFGGLPLRHLAFPNASNDIPHRREALSGPGPRRDREHPSGIANSLAPFEAAAGAFDAEAPPFGEARCAAQERHSKLAKTAQTAQTGQNRSKSAEAEPPTVCGPTRRKPCGLLSLAFILCN